MQSVRLNTGAQMPVLGLGTWQMTDAEAEKAVRTALDMGYRLIDTATLYGNERGVGKAVCDSNIPREEIFVTTKLWPSDFFAPQQAFDESMERLGLEYVDLYLVHWPIPMMPRSVWQAMEKIYESARARAIGISNYGIGDIEKLLEYAKIVPAVNQVKFSPFDFQEEVLKCSRTHGVVLEAYSPLTRGSHLNDPAICDIATAHGKTPAQVMLRWCIEHGAVVIPKSSDPRRMRENMDVFDFSLTPADMGALDTLS